MDTLLHIGLTNAVLAAANRCGQVPRSRRTQPFPSSRSSSFCTVACCEADDF